MVEYRDVSPYSLESKAGGLQVQGIPGIHIEPI